MSEDFIDFTKELLETTKSSIDYSHAYLEARRKSSHCFNQLQTLIYKADLHKNKKSIENKITELLSSEIYGKQARELNEEMQQMTAEYKGLELVIKSYHTHASAIQSVIKTQISGEISENIKQKYNKNYYI